VAGDQEINDVLSELEVDPATIIRQRLDN
jgi:hypothetical protein